jgi:hypothetical protein
MSSVLTFVGWGLSSLLFVGAAALLQANQIGWAVILLLWGILFLPPLYKITQRWEPFSSTWNILSRLGLILLIPAFLAPLIGKKDTTAFTRGLRNPFAVEQSPRSTPRPSALASANPVPINISSPVPVLNPLDLKVGQAYVTASDIPLMPASNPTNAQINQLQLIPIGGVFQVLGTEQQRNQLWYQVAAFDQERKLVGNGWINSTKVSNGAVPTTAGTVPSSILGAAPKIPGAQPTPSSLAAPTVSVLKSSPTPAAQPNPQVTVAKSPVKSPFKSLDNSPATATRPPAIKAPSKSLAANSKPGAPKHRVSSEPIVNGNGSRIVIETDDPNISQEQCKALVQSYKGKAAGKGQIVVYKPYPQPPWSGRVLAFCFNDLDPKGTVINRFYGD